MNNSLVVYNSVNRITQHYGGDHKGVDIGFSSNEWNNRIYANCSGVVDTVVDGKDNDTSATGTASWGNFVLIRHSNGYYSRYAHLKKNTIVVSEGQLITNSQYLGIMGDSGRAFGRHLHYEVATGFSSITRINPEPYLSQTIDGSTPVYIPEEPTPPTPTITRRKRYNFVLFNRRKRLN